MKYQLMDDVNSGTVLTLSGMLSLASWVLLQGCKGINYDALVCARTTGEIDLAMLGFV